MTLCIRKEKRIKIYVDVLESWFERSFKHVQRMRAVCRQNV